MKVEQLVFSSFPLLFANASRAETSPPLPSAASRGTNAHSTVNACMRKAVFHTLHGPDTCWINRALKKDWRAWWRTEIPARIEHTEEFEKAAWMEQGWKKPVETNPARNVNKYKFNLELHNNHHLTIEAILNKHQCIDKMNKCIPVTKFQTNIC